MDQNRENKTDLKTDRNRQKWTETERNRKKQTEMDKTGQKQTKKYFNIHQRTKLNKKTQK